MTAFSVKKETAAFMILFILSAGLFFFRLGERSFRNPDEGRYATIAKEMVKSGDWVRPTLYGIPYLRKPILFYWLLGISFKLLGFHEAAARLVPAIFGILGILVTYYFARRLLGWQAAIFSSLVLLANCWYVHVGRYLVIDMVFSFFVVLGLYLFYLGACGAGRSTACYVGFYVCVAISFLAKGVLGFAIPGFSIVAYLILSKKFVRVFKEMKLAQGILIVVVLVGPWLYLISRRESEFWNVFFVREHLRRMISSHFEHQEPWYYYLVAGFGLCLPWSLYVGPLKKLFEPEKNAKINDIKIFLFVVIIATVVFLSLSKAKLATYILPCMPFVSILIGTAWGRWTLEEQISSRQRFWTGAVLFFFLLTAIGFLLTWPRLFLSLGVEMVPGIEKELQCTAAAVIVGCVMGLRALGRGQIGKLFFSQVFMMYLISGIAVFEMENMNSLYTTKTYAEVLSSRLTKGQSVYIYSHPGAFYDFGFYLEHPVKLIGLEGELEGTKTAGHVRDSYIRRDHFMTKLMGRENMFCLIRKSDFLELDPAIRKSLKILKEDSRKILFESTNPSVESL
jgi:4-amino-4-deoxy-L-arabinose transferase-like glycosyltransferase